MSDAPQGPGWWQASDGKWYPPQPQAQPVAPPANSVAPGPGWWQASDGNWYPPQPLSAPAPQKKFYKRVWFWLLVVVALLIGGCVSIISLAGVVVDKANARKHTVVYSVTGPGTADITYDTFTSGNAGSASVSGATLPWSRTVTGSGIFSAYSVTAQIQTGTSVTCTITVDGRQVSTNTATGQFGVADCAGTAF
jgi:hypothetical protein